MLPFLLDYWPSWPGWTSRPTARPACCARSRSTRSRTPPPETVEALREELELLAGWIDLTAVAYS